MKVFWIIYVAVIAWTAITYWILFQKAGQSGWAAIIPFYNVYILLKIVGRPGGWLILLMIPFVSLVMQIIVFSDLAESFGKGGGFTVGLILFPPIFVPILAFGSATYIGPPTAADDQWRIDDFADLDTDTFGCSECGFRVGIDDEFCNNCGAEY